MIFKGARRRADAACGADLEHDVQVTAANVDSDAAKIPLFINRNFGSNRLSDDVQRIPSSLVLCGRAALWSVHCRRLRYWARQVG